MCANGEGSGETVRMHRLAWAFAGRPCNEYHNLISWLNCQEREGVPQGKYSISGFSARNTCIINRISSRTPLTKSMAWSLMGNYEEIQHICQHHTGHWKSACQCQERSPVQWHHKQLIQNYSRSPPRVSTLTQPSWENHVWGTVWSWSNVSIGGRLIIKFRFAEDTVVNAEEEEDADVLVERLDTTTTRYKLEILPRRQKIANNPNDFQSEIKIKCQTLEAVENFKCLGSIISINDQMEKKTRVFSGLPRQLQPFLDCHMEEQDVLACF